MANIAEGYGRYHYLDCLRFYYIARGSLTRRSVLITAHDAGLHWMNQRFQELYDLGRETERALNGYIRLCLETTARPGQHTELVLSPKKALHTILCPYLANELTEKPVS